VVLSVLHVVARITILGHIESCIPIVTGTAKFAVLHVFHGRLVCATLGFKQVGMAFVTAKHLYMWGVRESNITGIFVFEEDIADIMAGEAIATNAESLLPVVTGSAELTFLDRFHADLIAVTFLYEELWVTHFTFSAMHTMGEENLADGLGLQVDFVYNLPYHNGMQDRRQGNHQQKDH
jgi:hypothetical protein